jgi:cyclophilin family peptidyl-prolyl cis-trans isomerase
LSKKKSKRSAQRNRPQAAEGEAPKKTYVPRSVRKPVKPTFWQRVRANPLLLGGLIVAAVAVVVVLAWLVFRLSANRSQSSAGLPLATVTLRPTAPQVTTTPAPASQSLPTGTSAGQASAVRSWSAPPPMTIDTTKHYTATIVTDKGDITMQLFAAEVPKTVNSFVFLARQGFYDGVTFHRVIAGFMAQAGDPTGTGSGGPGYKFDDEFSPSLKHDAAGIVSMANAGPNTNGSQFFITYARQPQLDGVHSVFGKVTAGMDVLQKITPRDPATATTPGDKIRTIRITEN